MAVAAASPQVKLPLRSLGGAGYGLSTIDPHVNAHVVEAQAAEETAAGAAGAGSRSASATVEKATDHIAKADAAATSSEETSHGAVAASKEVAQVEVEKTAAGARSGRRAGWNGGRSHSGRRASWDSWRSWDRRRSAGGNGGRSDGIALEKTPQTEETALTTAQAQNTTTASEQATQRAVAWAAQTEEAALVPEEVVEAHVDTAGLGTGRGGGTRAGNG